jgi:hypothetical protein
MKRLLPTLAAILFFCLPFSTVVSAQDTTHMGTEFWVGYGHHQFMESGSNTQQMTLYFSTGSQPAVVTLTIDSSGSSPTTTWQRVYNIPADTVISIEAFGATSNTGGAGSSGLIPKGTSGQYDARLYSTPPPAGTGSTGLFRKKGIHIESSVPIAAYAHIFGSASSGATMLLPVKAWGYTYTSINSKQQYASNCYSWAFVIAKEDSTPIQITPSVVTRAQNITGLQPGVPTNIILQKGQIYQIMGANLGADANGNGGTSSGGYELTGTIIKSLEQGKAIGVFAGSSRTSNPATCGSGGGDNDIAQLFPLHIWGKKYLTAPTSSSTSASTFHTNIYKIAVYDPATVVRRNGIILTGLLANSYYLSESNLPDLIEADKPIMVAQFMAGGSCTPGIGDPDMYYLSPIDAGIKKVISIRTTKESISTQYLTLIIPTAGLSSLLVDGNPTVDVTYAHPRMPGYSVVVKKWTAGNSQLIVQSDSAFTGIAYGLGNVESYGFNLGAKFNPLHGVDPLFRMTWTGNDDTNWNNGKNWSTGSIPNLDDHVFVEGGTPNNLVISNGLEVWCKSLTIAPTANVTVQPAGKINVQN